MASLPPPAQDAPPPHCRSKRQYGRLCDFSRKTTQQNRSHCSWSPMAVRRVFSAIKSPSAFRNRTSCNIWKAHNRKQDFIDFGRILLHHGIRQCGCVKAGNFLKPSRLFNSVAPNFTPNGRTACYRYGAENSDDNKEGKSTSQ